MATNKTTNYQLNQWEPTDQVLRTDFNADNAKLDTALAGLAAKGTELEADLAAAAAGAGNCQMELFTYTGTGTCGADGAYPASEIHAGRGDNAGGYGFQSADQPLRNCPAV